MWLHTWRFVLAAIRTGIPRVANTLGLCVRDAARALRRSPSHALFILIILAVGISAATVTFSVVDAVVLKPLPFEQGDDIVNLPLRTKRFANGPLSVEEFWAIHDRVTALESVAQWVSWPVETEGAQETLRAARTTASLFRVLRLKPIIGQAWTADDEARGIVDLALISHR